MQLWWRASRGALLLQVRSGVNCGALCVRIEYSGRIELMK